MPRSTYLKTATLAATYLLWLSIWLVFGDEVFGARHHYWSQASVSAIAALVAFYSARRVPRPYPWFLAMQGVAFLLLAVSWTSYPASPGDCHLSAFFRNALSDVQCTFVADSVYGLCIFVLLCAWSFLGLTTWQGKPLSLFTMAVFAVLMLGLGAIFAGYYLSQETEWLAKPDGRLDAVTAALEFAVMVAGLFCMLLRVRPVVVWALVGTVILVTGDMGYAASSAPPDGALPPMIDAVWMFGQMVVLAAFVTMPDGGIHLGAQAEPVLGENTDSSQDRSGLSGILILVSLGAVLLSPIVWFVPVDQVWQSFFAVLFVIALVLVLVWLTDRFDDTVAYLRNYVRKVHESRLVSKDWRNAPPRIRAALQSTGLGTLVDEFRDSAAQLKHNVLFLGSERLFAPPRDHIGRRTPSCFIVMPFGQDWSADVHRILAKACEAAGVNPVRGDDLFAPSDILDDIWHSINDAEFVIADITGRNPNVLYELGIAHTLAKPVVIVSKNAADIPIDLATRRVILYGQSGEDWRADLSARISAAVAKVVEEYGLEAKQRRGLHGDL